MRSMLLSAAALAAGAVAVSPAAAADKCFDKATLTYIDCPAIEPIEAPLAPAPLLPAEPIEPWSGLYIGGHLGYGYSEATGTGGLGEISEDIDSLAVGGHVGFMRQFDSNLVLGLEADASALFKEDTDEVADAEIVWLSTARARLGFAIDQVMPYVTGGVALVNWEYEEPGATADETSFGYVAGGGVELLTYQNWMLRAEGLYILIDDDQSLPGGSVGLDDAIVGRGGLTYKF